MPGHKNATGRTRHLSRHLPSALAGRPLRWPVLRWRSYEIVCPVAESAPKPAKKSKCAVSLEPPNKKMPGYVSITERTRHLLRLLRLRPQASDEHQTIFFLAAPFHFVSNSLFSVKVIRAICSSLLNFSMRFFDEIYPHNMLLNESFSCVCQEGLFGMLIFLIGL